MNTRFSKFVVLACAAVLVVAAIFIQGHNLVVSAEFVAEISDAG